MKYLTITIALLIMGLASVSSAQATEPVEEPVSVESPSGEEETAADQTDEETLVPAELEVTEEQDSAEVIEDAAAESVAEEATDANVAEATDEGAVTEEAEVSSDEAAEESPAGEAEPLATDEAAASPEPANEGECVTVVTQVNQKDAVRARKLICADCGTCCTGCQLDAGTENWANVGTAFSEVNGNSGSFEQYGVLPDGPYTSGRMHTKDGPDAWDRFEVRWQDVHAKGGRGWTRLTLWPLTLQADSALISGRAWDSFAADPNLVAQEAALDDVRLRFHRGEFIPMELAYERFELTRDDATLLDNLTVQRLGYRYNFKLCGIDTVGQLRQTGIAIDSEVPGATGRINQTRLKLDTRLDRRLAAYSRLDYSAYKYDELPDSKFAGADWTVGLRYVPEDCWDVTAELRTKDNPDDNTVSSHVRNLMELGLAVNYAADGNSYEVGYEARRVDYAKLDMQDGAVFSLLRGSSAITPGMVGHAIDVLTPTQDHYWIDLRQNLSDDLRFTTRVDYSGGDQPGSELTAAGSPSLLYDEQLMRRHGLSYTVDCNNQLEVSLSGQESLNTERDSRFDQHYFESSWLHRLDSHSTLMLALRSTDVTLTAPTFDGALYATDDMTYVATYGQNQGDYDYTLNLSLSEGSGAQEYTQTGAGAAIRFKELPLGLQVDWYDRDYMTFPGLNADGLSVGVNYKFDF